MSVERVCLDCPVSFIIGLGQGKKVRCDSCATARRKLSDNQSRPARRAAAKAAGKCICCFGRTPEPGNVTCRVCLEKRKAAKPNRRVDGKPTKKELARNAKLRGQSVLRRGAPIRLFVPDYDWDEMP